MRVTLIHNPGAGAQAAHDAESLVALLRAEGHVVSAHAASDGGWKAALDEPADLVAVAGGDGTVARVAKAFAGRGVPIAPLPAGTANNIARTLGLAGRHWEEIVRAWTDGRRVRLDIGLAEGPWGRQRFVEGLGAGLFACLLSNGGGASAQARRPEERVADALERLRKHALDCMPVELHAKLDGESIDGRYLLIEALNIAYVGPNLYLAPDSQPGDGTFEVVLVGEEERARLVQYLESWQTNRERLSVLPSLRGERLTIDWLGYDLHIDDELWPAPGERAPNAGRIELSIETSVEFLAPDAKRRS